MKRIVSILVVLALVITMVASFATTAFADDTYNKVSSADELTSGKYVIVVGGYAMGVFDNGWVTRVETTAVNSITNPDAGIVWTVTVDNGTVKLTDSNGVTVAPKTSGNGILAGDHNWAVSFNEDGTVLVNVSSADERFLGLNTSGTGGFRAYNNNSSNLTNMPHDLTFLKLGAEGSGDPVVPPVPELPDLPEGAIAFTHEGYLHGNAVVILAGDNQTVGDLTKRGFGAEKDMNYFKVLVVGADGKVVSVHTVLGRTEEGGVKTSLVCPEGGYIIGYNANLEGHEVIDGVKVGAKVTLYNVDLAAVRALEGNKEVTKEGFTFENPAEATDTTSEVVVYYPEGSLALTAGAQGAGLAGVNAVLGEDGTLTVDDDSYVVLVKTVYTDGTYTLTNKADGKYLTSGATGNGLTFEETATECSFWADDEQDGVVYIKNIGAVYGKNNQYLEFYEKNGFTTFGLKTTAAYVFNFVDASKVTVKAAEGGDPTPGDPTTGDAGIVLFAILGVVALAGAAVTAKVRA